MAEKIQSEREREREREQELNPEEKSKARKIGDGFSLSAFLCSLRPTDRWKSFKWIYSCHLDKITPYFFPFPLFLSLSFSTVRVLHRTFVVNIAVFFLFFSFLCFFCFWIDTNFCK